MKCSKCGKTLTKEQIFCSYCGEKVHFDQQEKEESVENVEIINEKVEIVEKSVPEQKYDLILYNAGEGLTRTVFLGFIQKYANCSISKAKTIIKNLPATLFSDVDYAEAINWTEEMKKLPNVKIGIIESEKNSFGPQVCTCDFSEFKKEIKRENTTGVIKNTSDLKKISAVKKISILEIISSAFSTIACVILLFCPLFFNSITAEINGEILKTKAYYSVFTLAYGKIKYILSGINISYWIIFDFIYIFVGFLIVMQAYRAIIKTVKKIIKYVKIGKKQVETKKDSFMDASSNLANNNQWGRIFVEGVFLFILGGFDGVVVSTLIVTVVIIAIGIILDKIIKFSNDKLSNKEGEE